MVASKISLEDRKKFLEEIVWPWNEPLMFERRRGYSTTDVEERYEKAHSEENIRKIAALGTLCLPPGGGGVHFYKGFGLNIESEEMQNTKRLAELCHKYGMKISVYVGGTIFSETFFLEVPEARDWVQIDQERNPITYSSHQTYRYMPCYNHEGYLDYMKKVLKYAIEEIKADRIFFDNLGIGRPEPQSCHCQECVKKFREFLKNKYDEETLRKRLGFTVLDNVFPPTYNIFNQPWTMRTIDDPLKQEWIDFRCYVKAKFYRELYKYIKSLNPSISVALNIKGIYGRNRAFREAIDHPRFKGACDCIIMDSNVCASLTDDGALISEVRSFKAARSLNMAVASPPCKGGKLEWAVAMAFNKVIKVPGFGYEGIPFTPTDPEVIQYFDFIKENIDLYAETENIADVAILRSFASMAYNNFDTHLSTILFEQTLIQSKILFDIIFDENLEDLSKWKVLTLANQESLSDKQLSLIEEYVQRGGGLVATENTSLYDEWRRRRPRYGLASLFGFEKPSEAHKTMNLYGKGRVVYLPKIEPAREMWYGRELDIEVAGAGYKEIPPSQWKLPVNWYELVEAIEWASGNNISLKVYAPLTVVAELSMKVDKSQMILHLVNFGKNILKDITVNLKIPSRRKVKEIVLLSPDFEEKIPIEYAEIKDGIMFKIPKLMMYDLTVISLSNKCFY
ncbi:MAG: beta-galactosidase [Candidatus Bathyarchaeia archaeon]